MKYDYSLEIAEIASTVILSLLSIVIPSISLEGTFIISSFGISIALGTFLLKRELIAQLNEKLELYGILSEIKDNDLRQIGQQIVNDTRGRLAKLSEGIIQLGTDEVYNSAITKIQAIRKGETILAVHTAQDGIEYLYAWEDVTPLKNYFLENEMAVQRGVEIKRIFVVRKSDILDLGNGSVNEKALRILEKHQAVGIDVTVAWMDDVLDTSLVEDYIAFGNSVVETHEMALGGRYHQVTLRRDRAEVDFYLDRFRKLRNFGRSLDQVLQELNVTKLG